MKMTPPKAVVRLNGMVTMNSDLCPAREPHSLNIISCTNKKGQSGPWHMRCTKGIFHAKMGSIKDRNGMDLTEAEDIKKRWQEYTEELYKIFMNQIIPMV